MWTPLLGTAFVVSLMAYTTKLVFWDADKEEREWRRARAQRQQAAAAAAAAKEVAAPAANKVLKAAQQLAKHAPK